MVWAGGESFGSGDQKPVKLLTETFKQHLCMHKILVRAQDSCACTRFLPCYANVIDRPQPSQPKHEMQSLLSMNGQILCFHSRKQMYLCLLLAVFLFVIQ